LGTDNLVRLLKRFRQELLDLGVDIHWDARVDSLITRDDGAIGGVRWATVQPPAVQDGSTLKSSVQEIHADAVVLAAGHSARELYTELLACGAKLTPKDFAVGFRIEHPQAFINSAQYGQVYASRCSTGGRGTLPPASYRLASTVKPTSTPAKERGVHATEPNAKEPNAKGPNAKERGVYSFCMCPGGQIVPTSLDEARLCVNGMSYSNRGSKWANSAVVVSVGSDFGDYEARPADGGESENAESAESAESTGTGKALAPELAGLCFQEAMEERAALMGGGELRCPVQRVSDFLEGVPSVEPLPESSYRLGVTNAPLHALYPPPITAALQEGLRSFARSMPGFDSHEALLHGVETRTSAPVQIERDRETCEATSLRGLYPTGEGAGYAGGIVSAAVDGVRVAEAVLLRLRVHPGAEEL